MQFCYARLVRFCLKIIFFNDSPGNFWNLFVSIIVLEISEQCWKFSVKYENMFLSWVHSTKSLWLELHITHYNRGLLFTFTLMIPDLEGNMFDTNNMPNITIQSKEIILILCHRQCRSLSEHNNFSYVMSGAPSAFSLKTQNKRTHCTTHTKVIKLCDDCHAWTDRNSLTGIGIQWVRTVK